MISGAWNIANALTMMRIVLTIPFVYLIWDRQFGFALIVFVVAGLSDYADGAVARLLRQETSFGRIMDPVADKLLTTAAFVALAIPREAAPTIPIWLAASVVGRDVVIVLGSLVVYLVAGFTQFKPSLAGKINTFLEILIVVVFLLVHAAGSMQYVLTTGYVIVLISVVVSGFGYIHRGARIYRESRSRTATRSAAGRVG
jgi:cardiolipin synthase